MAGNKVKPSLTDRGIENIDSYKKRAGGNSRHAYPAIRNDLLAQRETGNWEIILRSRVSAVRSRVQVFGTRYRFRTRTRTRT